MDKVVLIVDDHRETVEAIAALMLQNGWLPQCALNGEDAATIVRTRLPALIISDLSMPGMSGFDLAELLRSELGDKCPAMIALSAWSDTGVAKQAIDAGFIAVLTKPVELQQLLATMNLALLARSASLASA